MKRRSAIDLPPSNADIVLSRLVAQRVDRPVERDLRIITWLADEKLVLGFAALYWAHIRFGRGDPGRTCEADSMLCSVTLAGLLPHLIKRYVNRKRPNRTQAPLFRHGIARLGRAQTSFPSGHALHLGALAVACTRLAPLGLRPFVWPSAIALAGTRILLLAHYPSDVAAGLTLGALLHKAASFCLRRVSGAQAGRGAHRRASAGAPRRLRWTDERSGASV